MIENRMTEAEWLTCSDPIRLLYFIWGRSDDVRKYRLFVCGCCRRFESSITRPWWRTAMATVESFADGQCSVEELKKSSRSCRSAIRRLQSRSRSSGGDHVLEAVTLAIDSATHSYAIGYRALEEGLKALVRAAESLGRVDEAQVQADLFRCVMGNPFGTRFRVDRAWLSWNQGIIRQMAQGIYEDRAFDRLPILADALEEAGCTDVGPLSHCREPGIHTRGCCVIDALLGKR